jgi:formate-dependent nitrite reductase membrane component NrfD
MSVAQAPHWPFLIDVYFFLGGLAGGAFVIATVANLLDPARYRAVVRTGYYVSLAALLPCPIILVVDLGVPARFLNMLGTFNVSSPMSMGAWALLFFSVAAGLAALFTFLEDIGRARNLSGPKVVVGVIGGFFAFFLAAYPGVLIGATAVPLWTNGHALGALFLAVGASSGAAAIALILAVARSRRETLARVNLATALAVLIQLVALALFIGSVSASGSASSLTALGRLLGGDHGTLFWGGAVVAGSVLPLVLAFLNARRSSVGLTAVASVLVLLGAFLVKTVIMVAGQA